MTINFDDERSNDTMRIENSKITTTASAFASVKWMNATGDDLE
jgi:hypothetical protein